MSSELTSEKFKYVLVIDGDIPCVYAAYPHNTAEERREIVIRHIRHYRYKPDEIWVERLEEYLKGVPQVPTFDDIYQLLNSFEVGTGDIPTLIELDWSENGIGNVW
jgi:hypothetical protein